MQGWWDRSGEGLGSRHPAGGLVGAATLYGITTLADLKVL